MQTIQYKVLEEENGKRLDILISENKAILSRSQAQNAIKDRNVQVNNLFQKPSYRVSPGDIIDITIKDAVPLQAEPEDIYIEIIYIYIEESSSQPQMTLDGQKIIMLKTGQKIIFKKSEKNVKIIKGSKTFSEILEKKLHWMG